MFSFVYQSPKACKEVDLLTCGFLQLVPPTMTLFTIRTHLWKGPGNDVLLHYKANGRKRMSLVAAPKRKSGVP
jgi:hypothetical protein